MALKRFSLVFFLFFFLLMPLPSAGAGNGACEGDKSGPCRIVSLSPSVTETLFALGLGSDVVGVTRFCSYPPEACERPGVGGYIDPNYEAIVALEPDIAVLLPEQADVKTKLMALGINSITVDNKTVEDILASIGTLGRAFGVTKRAGVLTAELKAKITAIKGRVRGRARPTVVVSVARGMGSIGIKTVYVAGRDGYFDELITIAGGVNAYRDERMKFPRFSWEGLLSLNPDVIIDLVPSLEKKGWNKAEILHEWKVMAGLKAVDNKRVYILGEDYVTIPGPRFILLLEDMARAIHPAMVKAGEEKP